MPAESPSMVVQVRQSADMQSRDQGLVGPWSSYEAVGSNVFYHAGTDWDMS